MLLRDAATRSERAEVKTYDLLAFPERQLLALVLEIGRRPVDWETGARIQATAQVLVRHAPLMFGADGPDVAQATLNLTSVGLLRSSGEAHELTPIGRAAAERCRREMAAAAYGERLAAADASPAYERFCQHVYGIALAQYSVLDAEQLDAVVQAFGQAPAGVLLDIGCGAGRIAEYMADATGAAVVGIDIAHAAMGRARGRARYAVATAESLPFAAASLAGVYFIDVLNLCGDVAATLASVAQVMAPGARLCILTSEVTSHPDTDTIALAHASAIGRGLRSAGFRWELRDFSANERAIWGRARLAATELSGDFEAEGNAVLGADLLREAQRGERWASQGCLRRLFYIAVASPSA